MRKRLRARYKGSARRGAFRELGYDGLRQTPGGPSLFRLSIPNSVTDVGQERSNKRKAANLSDKLDQVNADTIANPRS